eukprot:Plantae.Rhodophyta-Hildenbrandia_rubra.ctg7500.p1 GENE.Plantae.Rhodophyta-Hildenbrandia_rubra.ctg7500~~Plantae.Rhodophyta-Hildenbrandia_rubra.ctg7500.p1  ORF type:complete len:338 (-),score=76.80 Plantae.Rhodophyta-Hildenbrandia_rubra.ctg7500:551-1564(-)
MATTLSENDVAFATVKILEHSDLKVMTLRKVMENLSAQFNIDPEAFAPWKLFVRGQIDSYLSNIPVKGESASHETSTTTPPTAKAERPPPPPPPTKLKGLMKAVVLAQPLADLLGEVVLPRTKISKRIGEYVKEHDLQNPEDRREILCDDKLRKTFDVDKFTYFTLNKHISHLVYKPQDCSAELQALAAKCEEKMLEEVAKKQAEDYANGIDPTEKKKSRKRKRVVKLDEDGNPPPRKLNGLSKPMQLDAVLADVCGQSVLSRSEVVKKLWEYIKSNNLQDPEDKRNIICDDKLKSVFDGESRILGFGLSKYLSAHLSKYEGEVDSTGRAVLPTEDE